MKLELYPVTNSGYVIQTEKRNFDPHKEFGKVCSVGFINQGINSRVTVKYASVEVVLDVKEWHAITAPVFGYDITQYDIYFDVIDPADPFKNNCKLSIQKYVE